MATRRQNLFSRLTRLFKAGPIVKRKVRGFDSASVQSSALDVFRKSTATVYGNSLNAYGQYDRLCVSSHTLISVPGSEKFVEIQELGKRYPNGEKFIIYSYDHKDKCIKPAWAHHPRCSGIKETVKVTFDDGAYLICTPDHECMLRDGSYVEAQDIKPGTSMMPFYRKEFQGRSVVSIEPYGKQEVWDLTVDGYENFATDTIIVHNSRYADFCLHGDTLVYTTKGIFSIKELAEKYKDGGIFHVYSYDYEENKVVISEAHSARMACNKQKQKLVKVTFTNGHIICTPEHKFVLRDGNYKMAKNLGSYESLMPFKNADLDGTGYRWIYKIDKNGKHKSGWRREHQIVAEYFNRPIEENEVVHHKDFNRANNLIENLQIMDAYEHNRYHAQLNNKNKFGKSNEKHFKWMKENNPVKRKDITFEKILEIAIETDFTMGKVKSILNVDQNVLKRKLREVGFKNWLDFKSKKDDIQNHIIHQSIVRETRSPEIEDILENWKDCENIYKLSQKLSCSTNAIRRRLESCGYGTWTNFKENNGYEVIYGTGRTSLIDDSINYQDICNAYQKGMTYQELAKTANTTGNKIISRIKKEGFSSYHEWAYSYNNHKVISIEYLKEEDYVYNLTVPNYHNFAAGSKWTGFDEDNKYDEKISCVFTQNSEMEYTPEIASALDIYADETVAKDEKGHSLHIYSENPKIKNLLEDLFYDTLNFEFASRAWVRNLPIRKNTSIPLLDGRNITIEELSKEYAEGKENWVYSISEENNSFVPGKVVWCDKTRSNSELVRVWLDDGTYVDTTPDHEFILRNGIRKKAEDLLKNESLMPFYRKVSDKKDSIQGYEKVYNPKSNYYVYTHRVVANNVLTENKKTLQEQNDRNERLAIHHTSFDKRNNNPNHLHWMYNDDHLKLHREISENFLQRPDIIQKRIKGIDKYLRSQKRADRLSREMSGIYPEYFKDYNNSSLHSSHNQIRSKLKKEMWNDFSRRKIAQENMSIKFDNKCVDIIVEHLNSKKTYIGISSMCSFLKKNSNFQRHFRKINKNSNRDLSKSLNSCSQFKLLFYRATGQGYLDYIEDNLLEIAKTGWFKRAKKKSKECSKVDKFKNHKITKVERIPDHDDVYCMTVLGPNGEEDRHNFAVCGNNIDGTISTNSGIYLQNCKYGDFFILNDVSPKYGVINAHPIPVNEIEREEGFDPENPFAVRFRWVTEGNQVLENWQVTHFRLLGNDTFLPYGSSVLESARRIWRQLCLHKESKVWTDRGYKEIQYIEPGDNVYSYDHENNNVISTTVKHVLNMGKQDVYKIKTNHRSIIATDKHGHLVKDKYGNSIYKPTKELTNKDYLYLPDLGEEGTSSFFQKLPKEEYSIKLRSKCEYNSNGIMKKIRSLGLACSDKNVHGFLCGNRGISFSDFEKLKEIVSFNEKDCQPYITNSKTCYSYCSSDLEYKIDEQFIKFFGFMIGDGWANEHTIGFALGENEEQNQQYINFIESFGFNGARFNKDGTKSASYIVYSTELALLFRCLGFKTGFRNKTIPEWAYKLSRKNKISLIKGLFDADGGDEDGRLSLSNKELIESVRILAQQAYIPTGEVKIDREGGSYYDHFFNKEIIRETSYRLYLNMDGAKTQQLCEKVLSVELYEKNAETYDLEVDHDLHNFICDGVVTHNTMAEDAMLVYRVIRSPERRVFYIDVANAPANDVPNIIENARTTLKSQEVIDKDAGRVDLRYNPWAVDIDYFIPVRGTEGGTRVDTLPGGANTTAIDDVEYIQRKLFAALKVPKAYLGFEEALCLHEDTQISLLDGRELSIKKIAEEYEEGKQNWVYSTTTDGEIRAGKVTWAGKTKTVKSLVKVVLDNNEEFLCTDNHPVLMRDGVYVDAKDLKPGVSVMPLYRKITDKKKGDKLHGYEKVLDLNKKKWIYTHRMVANSVDINIHESALKEKVQVIHHSSYNKKNNKPDELLIMGRNSHVKMHAEKSKILLSNESRDRLRAVMQTDKYKRVHLDGVLSAWKNDDGTRSDAIRSANKRYNKINVMNVALRQKRQSGEVNLSGEKNPNWIENPSFEDIIKIIRCGIFRKKDVRDNLSCSLGGIERTLKEYGFNTWKELTTRYDKTRKGRVIEWLDMEKLESIAADCKSKSSFYRTSGVSRCGFENYCKRNNINHKQWFVDSLNCNNHKVKHIEVIDCDVDVYDLTIDQYHNFALSCGVFVHNSSKANLAQEDIRFARSIQQIQQVIISELNKIAAIHLAAHGFDGEDLINFRLQLSNPSTMAQQQKLDLLGRKFEIASTRPEGMLTDKYIYKEIFGLTEEYIKDMEEDQVKELLRRAQMEQIGAAAAEGDGGLGGGGGGFGGGGGPGGGGLGGLELPDETDGEDLDTGDDTDSEETGDQTGGEDLFASEEQSYKPLITDDEDDVLDFELEENDDEYKPIHQQNQATRYRHNNLRPSRRKMRGSNGMRTPDPTDSLAVEKNPLKLDDAFQRHLEMIQDSENKRTRLSSETRRTIDSLSKRIHINRSNLNDSVPNKPQSLIIEGDEEEDNE